MPGQVRKEPCLPWWRFGDGAQMCVMRGAVHGLAAKGAARETGRDLGMLPYVGSGGKAILLPAEFATEILKREVRPYFTPLSAG